VDIEVHSLAGCFYVLDTARVFPPEMSPVRQSIFYQKLRPEFVRLYAPVPLSSDALTSWDRTSESTREIEYATGFLKTRFVDYAHVLLQDGEIKAIFDSLQSKFYVSQWSNFENNLNLFTVHLHKHGFNIRHLGMRLSGALLFVILLFF
jgi:hypothetical protein